VEPAEPAPTAISILPCAIGDTTASGIGSSFVTYGANGVRPLAAAEYLVDDLSGVFPAANVKLDNGTSGVPAASSSTVNSLVLATNGSNTGSVTGTGTLNVTSGRDSLHDHGPRPPSAPISASARPRA